MFKDKMDVKEKVSLGVSGPKVQPEEVLGPVVNTSLQHTEGCCGFMYIYYDMQSSEVRARCNECGSAYALARAEDGFFKRG